MKPSVSHHRPRHVNARIQDKMVLGKGKKANVAKTAIARELACFMWGMMTDHIV